MRAALASSCPDGISGAKKMPNTSSLPISSSSFDLGVGQFVIDLVGDLELAAVHSAERVPVVEVRLHAAEIALEQAVARRVAGPVPSTAYWIASSVTPGTPEIGANSPRSGPCVLGGLAGRARLGRVGGGRRCRPARCPRPRPRSTPARRPRSSRWLLRSSQRTSRRCCSSTRRARDRPRRSGPRLDRGDDGFVVTT